MLPVILPLWIMTSQKYNQKNFQPGEKLGLLNTNIDCKYLKRSKCFTFRIKQAVFIKCDGAL